MTKDNNGPAFPVVTANFIYSEGMSLRDWFAGQALVSLVSKSNKPASEYARRSYVIADEMLAERGKSE